MHMHIFDKKVLVIIVHIFGIFKCASPENKLFSILWVHKCRAVLVGDGVSPPTANA